MRFESLGKKYKVTLRNIGFTENDSQNYESHSL